MATIKFIIQGKSKNVPVYLRLSINKNTSFKRKTGLYINPQDWSKATGYPKQNNPDNKNLKTNLNALKYFIETSINNDTSKQISITSDWLQGKIETHNGNDRDSELNFLVPFTEYYIQNLINENVVSKSTIKKRKTIKNKLIAFEKVTKKKYLIKDVDLVFRNELIKYFKDIDGLSKNTVGRYLKEVKTICLNAETHDIETSSQLKNFKGFKEKGVKITLSFDELEAIQKLKYKEPKIEAIKDWLIIGCYTGQRGSDLFRMNKLMIETIEGFDFITLTQKKTKKLVQIPIHPIVKEILNKRDGEFPLKLSDNVESSKTIFNKIIKSVCKDAKIVNEIRGRLKNPKTNRIEERDYPKYKLIASHTCRRSFATNFYAQEKFPTPILMNITAHSTEKMFLEYIGKKPIDYSLQLAKTWNN